MANDELPPRAGISRLKYTKGRTLNLGNFESVRVDIGIELDAKIEDIPATYDRMVAWVNKRIEAEVARRNNGI